MSENSANENSFLPAVFIIDSTMHVTARDQACEVLLGFNLIVGQSVDDICEHSPQLHTLLHNGSNTSICWHKPDSGQVIRASITTVDGLSCQKLRVVVIQEALQDFEHSALRQSRLEEINAGLAQQITEQVAREVEKTGFFLIRHGLRPWVR